MTRAKKRPRGFHARLARARNVAAHAVYRELNPDTLPCVRAQHECDATWPLPRAERARMDRAFCDAVRREIARGSERPRGTIVARGRATAASPRHARELPTKQLRAGSEARERRG